MISQNLPEQVSAR